VSGGWRTVGSPLEEISQERTHPDLGKEIASVSSNNTPCVGVMNAGLMNAAGGFDVERLCRRRFD